MSNDDGAGDSIESANASWSFGGKVSKQFDDHVTKSVPLYNEGHDLILKLSDYFLHDDSICYDLGCSTGANLYNLRQFLQVQTQLIGIDNSQPMLDKCQQKLELHNLAISN